MVLDCPPTPDLCIGVSCSWLLMCLAVIQIILGMLFEPLIQGFRVAFCISMLLTIFLVHRHFESISRSKDKKVNLPLSASNSNILCPRMLLCDSQDRSAYLMYHMSPIRIMGQYLILARKIRSLNLLKILGNSNSSIRGTKII